MLSLLLSGATGCETALENSQARLVCLILAQYSHVWYKDRDLNRNSTTVMDWERIATLARAPGFWANGV